MPKFVVFETEHVQFLSNLIGTPEDRFSRDEAHIVK